MSTVDPSQDAYFSGSRLYGDDFVGGELERWLEDEREAYAALVATAAGQGTTYRYVYHSMNTIHGFRRLPDRRFEDVLGFGAAYAHEFLPILSRVGRITIVDPSLGKIPFTVDEGMTFRGHVVEKHTHLTVLELSGGSTILLLDAS